jgi:nitrite reductase (NO-forming)
MIYTGKQSETVYLPEGSTIQTMPASGAPAKKAARGMSERMSAGNAVYVQNCAACHQPDGKGLKNAFPPLAGSDFLMADKKRAIRVVLEGLAGKIEVNGSDYDGVMPALSLDDEDIANVLTYVRNSWGNKGDEVSASEVGGLRKK